MRSGGSRDRGRLAPVVTAGAGLIVGLALVATGLSSGDEAPVPAAVVERPPLPTGSEVPGREGVESSAERLAAALDAVARSEEEACEPEDLEVRWEEPSEEPAHGAWVEPVGPAPGADDTEVNGLVACEGSDHEVAGFQASFQDGRWSVAMVPDLGHDDAELHPEELHGGDEREQAAAQHHAADDGVVDDETVDDETADDGALDPPGPEGLEDELPLPAEDEVPEPTAAPALPGVDPQTLADDSPWVGLWDPEIEPLADYEPQQLCSPSAKPGAIGLRSLVLRAYPMTGDSGISRACHVGGRSEHKEGRAWDWAVHVSDPEEHQAAAEVLGWLLATDEHGNEHAMARRLGVMYVIYNGNIWSAYAAERGWQPYVGRSDHTDHVHISFDEAGGLAQTSFWDVPGLEDLANSRFGPAAILPEHGGGIGFELDAPEGDPAPEEAPAGTVSPPASAPPSTSQSGGGGGGGAPGPTPSSPAPVAPPPPPPPPPPVTLPPVTLPRPPDLGPIDDLLDPLVCGLLPCGP